MDFGSLRRVANGVIPQAVIAGSLSFSHIHDLAQAHGQLGWKAWTYPLSVDLLSVAAYRKVAEAQHAKRPVLVPWFWFVLSLAASLAANIIATGGRDPLSISVGVWPSVAFLGCTLLGHRRDTGPASSSASPSSAMSAGSAVVEVVDQAPEPMREPVPPASTDLLPAVVTPAAAPAVSNDLLDFASKVAHDHHTRTGEFISVPALRQRLGVGQPLAEAVYDRLNSTAHSAT